MKAKSALVEKLHKSLRPGPFSSKLTARTYKPGSIRFGASTAPGPSKTPSQEAWRLVYSTCVTEWNGLTPEEKAAYQEDADKRDITAFNQFMSECLMLPYEKLYERYTPFPDERITFWAEFWIAQTFTIGNTGPNESFELSRVELMLYQVDASSPVALKIRATDGEGKPTGGDISRGWTPSGTLPVWPNHVWRSIDMSQVTLLPDTQYALIMLKAVGDAEHYVEVGDEYPNPTYTGGHVWDSEDSGFNWSPFAKFDLFFKIFGRKPA